jgi:hypothetical protein
MCCLHVIGMVVSPRSSHALGFDMVGHDLAAIGERCVANRTPPFLLDDLSIEQLAHLGWRAQFAISPGVVRIFDALNAKPKSAFLLSLFTTAAIKRAVDRTVFIPTEFHGNAPV